ncbi:MAG: hypothetical protein GY870_18690 [archaeon]|nr:hypothetical protein [archaeon]
MDYENKEERFKFMEAFSAMCLALDKEPTKAFVKVYFDALKEFDIKDVLAAISQSILKSSWFPKPVELRSLIGGSNTDNSEIQCAQAFEAVRRVGPYESVVFDDPVTQEVIKQYYGGWPKFCEGDEGEEVFKKNDFKKAYKSFSNQNRKHYGPLYGISAIGNDSNGIKQKPKIKMIGNPERCKQIMDRKKENKPLVTENPNVTNIVKKLAESTKV